MDIETENMLTKRVSCGNFQFTCFLWDRVITAWSIQENTISTEAEVQYSFSPGQLKFGYAHKKT